MNQKTVVALIILAMFVSGCAQQGTEVFQPPIPPEGLEPATPVETVEPTEPVVTEPKVFARITINEGELVKLDLDAEDPDGDPLYYTFSAPLDEKGVWQTKLGDAGQYPVTVTVSDGTLKTSKEILIIVKAVNQAPRMMAPEDITVVEGEKVVFDLKAEDPNGDKLTWKYGAPIGTDGTWQTKTGDKGKYEVQVTVSDGELSDSATMFVNVLPGNLPPKLEIETTVSLKEGETVKLEPKVSDPDGDNVTVSFSGWMTQAEYTTGYDDQGKHKVVVTASDGAHEESAVVWVDVLNVNRPPEIHGLIVK
ncbi:MAG: hypothetical protein ABIG95_05615 [Candidatus Woesearchaeota archaeon]